MMRITTLLLASMLTMMAGAIVAPALPEITLHFRGIPNHEIMARLVITLPALAIALTSFIMGMLVDRRGRVPVLIGSLILYLLAGTSVVFIQNPYLILTTRFVLGIAVSGIMTAVLTLIGDYYQGEERNRVMGIQGGFMGIGGVVFISLSGFLADFSWQTPFLLYGFALPVLVLSFFYITEPNITKKQPKTAGDQSNAIKAKPYHWPMVLLVIFSGFTGIVFFFMMPVQLPYLLKEIPELPNWKIGIGIATSTMSAAVVAMNLRKIRRWISNPQMYVVAFFFMSIGYFLFPDRIRIHSFWGHCSLPDWAPDCSCRHLRYGLLPLHPSATGGDLWVW
jgi:MFS family permease